MFKNVGIYVRQKSNHGVDLSAMDSMISFLANQNINLKIDKSSDYQNELIEAVYLIIIEFSGNKVSFFNNIISVHNSA